MDIAADSDFVVRFGKGDKPTGNYLSYGGSLSRRFKPIGFRG
jgi:hypothetical protein